MIKLVGTKETYTIEPTYFPDGQPHIKIPGIPAVDYPDPLVVKTRITNPSELFSLLLVDNILHKMLKQSYCLDIMYLMGGRMDRPIDNYQPFTLQTVVEVLKQTHFNQISFLDTHSVKTEQLFFGSKIVTENILPIPQVNLTIRALYKKAKLFLVAPDGGARHRVHAIANDLDLELQVISCSKERDSQTGEIHEILVAITEDQKAELKGWDCLIVDDLCDGGRTFIGVAEALHKIGTNKVNLFVTHGIFSKGPNLEGIKSIWTTNSYKDTYPEQINVLPVW